MSRQGGDSFKQRTKIEVRREMIQALYEDHPRVLFTKMSSVELQKMSKENIAFKTFVHIVGILGVDAALDIQKCPNRSKIFMSGRIIPDKYKEHTIGNLLALRADSFILVKRSGYLDFNDTCFLDRPVDAYIDHNVSFCSSTRIRNAISKRQDVSAMCSKEVIEVIRNHDLYND